MYARGKLVPFIALALVAAGACASNPSPTEPSDDVRSIAVEALDSLRFEPASIAVDVGETVRFVVTNAGEIPHEFVLGDEATQQAHEEQMTDQGHMAMEAMASLTLEPGATQEATVTFDAAGEFLFGCHVPGHYAGGMVGTVTVG